MEQGRAGGAFGAPAKVGAKAGKLGDGGMTFDKACHIGGGGVVQGRGQRRPEAGRIAAAQGGVDQIADRIPPRHAGTVVFKVEAVGAVIGRDDVARVKIAMQNGVLCGQAFGKRGKGCQARIVPVGTFGQPADHGVGVKG